MSKSLTFAHFLFFGERYALERSFPLSHVSESLTSKKRCERIAQVAHQKWATMCKWVNHFFLSESLISSFLGKKQAIR